MCILAKMGRTYARLQFSVGPGGHVVIPVKVDYTAVFEASDHESWEQEYKVNVQPGVLAVNDLEQSAANQQQHGLEPLSEEEQLDLLICGIDLDEFKDPFHYLEDVPWI